MSIITNIISAILPKAVEVIDQAVLDKDLAQKLKNDLTLQLIAQQSEMDRAARDIIVAEANGESWLQRSWRPMLMLWFAVLIGAYWFGFVPENLSEEAIGDLFTLVQIGVGGYVVGRSGEKIASTISNGGR